MPDNLFSALQHSMEEAISIKKGELASARITTVEIPDCKVIRNKLGLTQDEFSRGIGVAKETVKKWEQGKRNPAGTAAKLLRMIEQDLSIYEKISRI